MNYEKIFKVGDIVRTKKGDRFNGNAKHEDLKILKFLGESKQGFWILCLKSNGNKSRFSAKNLYKV